MCSSLAGAEPKVAGDSQSLSYLLLGMPEQAEVAAKAIAIPR